MLKNSPQVAIELLFLTEKFSVWDRITVSSDALWDDITREPLGFWPKSF